MSQFLWTWDCHLRPGKSDLPPPPLGGRAQHPVRSRWIHPGVWHDDGESFGVDARLQKQSIPRPRTESPSSLETWVALGRYAVEIRSESDAVQRRQRSDNAYGNVFDLADALVRFLLSIRLTVGSRWLCSNDRAIISLTTY